MLGEVKVYKPDQKGNLRLERVISKEDVAIKFDEQLNTSRSHFVNKKQRFKSSGNKRSSEPTKYALGAVKKTCQVCERTYYATNKRNTKFCSQKCGRIMSNEYKKEREQLERDKKSNANSTVE